MTLHGRLILLAAALPFTLAACSDAHPLEPTSPPLWPAGCYEVRMGRWSGPKSSPNLPAVITLLDSIGTAPFEEGMRLVRPHPVGAAFPFHGAWWKPLDPYHLKLLFSVDGVFGLQLELLWSLADGTYGGTAIAWTDTDWPQAIATASLRPRTC
jgi:hypothetical protein